MRKQTVAFTPLPYPQTHYSARRWFQRNGVAKAEWARYFGLPRTTVAHVLSGRSKGTYGDSHKAAVLLGLKENPDGQQ